MTSVSTRPVEPAASPSGLPLRGLAAGLFLSGLLAGAVVVLGEGPVMLRVAALLFLTGVWVAGRSVPAAP